MTIRIDMTRWTRRDKDNCSARNEETVKSIYNNVTCMARIKESSKMTSAEYGIFESQSKVFTWPTVKKEKHIMGGLDLWIHDHEKKEANAQPLVHSDQTKRCFLSSRLYHRQRKKSDLERELPPNIETTFNRPSQEEAFWSELTSTERAVHNSWCLSHIDTPMLQTAMGLPGLIQAVGSGCSPGADGCIQFQRVNHEIIKKIRVEICSSSQCLAAGIMYVQKQEKPVYRTNNALELAARKHQINKEGLVGILKGVLLYLIIGSFLIVLTKITIRSRVTEVVDDAESNELCSDGRENESQDENDECCPSNDEAVIFHVEIPKNTEELSEYIETEPKLPNLEDIGSQLSLSNSACPIESEEDVGSSEMVNDYMYVIGENSFDSPKKRMDFFKAIAKKHRNSIHKVRFCPPYKVIEKITKERIQNIPFKQIQSVRSLTDTFTKGSDWSKRGHDLNNDDDIIFLREITWLPLSQLPVPSIDITIALVHSQAQEILERIATGETVGAHESMKYEILRVCTFRHYPGEGKPFRILLASAGLYYASEGDEVVCYCCGLRRSGWREVDKPLQIHKQLKPSCDFLVRNHDFNVAIPDLPAENAAKFRILDEIGDSSNAVATENLQQRRKTGYPDSAENLHYRVYTPPPKHPQYAEPSVRLESFKNWPTNIPQTAQIMAECGYYYAGFGDCVRCFHCGIGLRHWTEDDYPWIEHARWSKDCAYLREKKGEEFIQNVHLAIDDEEEAEDLIPATPNGQPADISQVTPREESSQILLTDPAQSVLEMGYQPRIIKKAIDIILHDEGHSGISAQKIMETIFMLEERESTSNLQQGIDSMNISGASAGSITQSESSRNTDLKQSTAEEPKSQTTKTGKIPANDAVSWSHKSSEGKAKGKAVSGQTHGSLQGGTEVDKILPKQHETANALNSPNSSLEDKKQGVASGTSKPRDTTKIKDENKRLKEQTVCKICLDKPVAIVFLPCGHLVTCAECAPAMRKCPICRALVKGSVKAFMS